MDDDVSNLNKRIGALLASCRKRKGFSQKELADEAQIAISSVRGLERGANKPSLDMIVKLSKTLEIDASELFSPENTPSLIKNKIIIDIISNISKLDDMELLKIRELIKVFLKPK